MGVHHLWELLLPIGRRVSIESLEGQILAIDASIWLTQLLTIQQKLAEKESGGEYSSNTRVHYLANTLKRLCKLRYQGIRPVLVFDGATPEIKKREIRERQRKKARKQETFLGDDTPEAVQRAAKRLLAKQLRKGAGGKLILKSGAEAAVRNGAILGAKQEDDDDENSDGFYDPEAEEREKQKREPMEVSKQIEEQNENLKRKRQEEEEELNKLLEDDDYLNDASNGFQESQNDWDVGASSTADHNAATDDSQDDDTAKNNSNSSKPFRPNRRPGHPKLDTPSINLDDYHADDGTHLAIHQVAQLDPTQRKDVVEHAQKKRYLASRREYLQQAYDPEGLSQTQLRNFLKYTRLNQDIAQMAKQAAKLKERDKALKKEQRIIFEKDDENNNVEDINVALKRRPKPTAQQKQKQLQRLKKQKLSLLQDTDDEKDGSDSDEEIWNGKSQNRPARHRGDNYFRKVVLDDEEEEEGHEDTGSYASPTGGGGSTVSFPYPTRQNASAASSKFPLSSPSKKIQIQDDDDGGDSEIEVWEDGDINNASPPKSDAALAQELQDEALARALQEEEEDSMVHNDFGGGFLINHQSLSEKVDVEKVIVSIDDSDDTLSQEEVDDRKPAACNPNKINEERQEREDAALAKSLQDMEYGEDVAGGFLPVKEAAAAEENDVEAKNVANGAVNCMDEESEGEDVSWEDGDDEVDGSPVVASFKLLADRSLDAKYSDEDDMQWEDGDDEKAAEEQMEGRKQCNSDDEIEAVDAVKEMGDGNGNDSDGDEEIDPTEHTTFQTDDWGAASSSTKKSSKDLTAALEQAQATAANLTNWAGRAFRRAVADHAAEQGMHVPDSAKTKKTKDSTTAVSLPTGPTAANSVFDASPPDIARKDDLRSRVEFSSSRKSTPSAAPAFDFLDTLEETVGDSGSGVFESTIVSDRGQNAAMAPGGTASDEMRTEVMHLLQLFGIPYVVAPAEAEAQCVELERLGLVNGIVTEDSDAFVFGASIVYKNLFKDQKWVEAYHAKDAVAEMSLNRDALVALAMLMGGDYTEGIKGVGLVNAMEILDAFDVADDCKEGLRRFRKWLDGFDPSDLVAGADCGGSKDTTAENEFHKKHRSARNRWIAPKHFPDERVFNAYWNPVVDTSRERFSWGMPNLEGLVVFCQQNLGWPADETKTLIHPIIERLQSTTGSMRQTRLDSYMMKYEDGLKFATIRSKRLQSVLKKNAKKKTQGQKHSGGNAGASDRSDDE